jgi:hypothetical protein
MLPQGSAAKRARLEQVFPVKETGQPVALQLTGGPGAAPPASVPPASQFSAGAQGEEGAQGWVGGWGREGLGAHNGYHATENHISSVGFMLKEFQHD